jgi:hypothetical protein
LKNKVDDVKDSLDEYGYDAEFLHLLIESEAAGQNRATLLRYMESLLEEELKPGEDALEALALTVENIVASVVEIEDFEVEAAPLFYDALVASNGSVAAFVAAFQDTLLSVQEATGEILDAGVAATLRDVLAETFLPSVAPSAAVARPDTGPAEVSVRVKRIQDST